MSVEDAEEEARQMSLKNPDELYYVDFDDINHPISNYVWINGKRYDWTDGRRYLNSLHI